MATEKHHHFLILTVEAQGHINPARHLAQLLVLFSHVRVTIAFSTSAYRRMFPSADVDLAEDVDRLISYAHYTDAFKHGEHDVSEMKLRFKDSVSVLTKDLADHGRPITCIIYSLFLSAAADVAGDLSIPSVLLWIQPASVFAIYNSYFHGSADIIKAHRDEPSFNIDIPGLQSLMIRDLPSFLTSTELETNLNDSLCLLFFKDMFETLDREAGRCMPSKPRVLANTFHELEVDAISNIQGMEMIPVGPLVATETTNSKSSVENEVVNNDLYQEDSSGYMEWLDRQSEKSVVYVSFGSISKISGPQMEELARGLSENDRPYLWVVRQNNREEEAAGELLNRGDKNGMIVEWCSQNRVLSHPAIGCFVTHCGWNSMLESMVCGVPMVMAPQWSDQLTNAKLAEGDWGIGVRAVVNGEKVLEGNELKRCVDIVMGDQQKGMEIRTRAATWRSKAVKAIAEGGSSDRNLRSFMESL